MSIIYVSDLEMEMLKQEALRKRIEKNEVRSLPMSEIRSVFKEDKKTDKRKEDIYELHSAKGRKTSGKVYA